MKASAQGDGLAAVSSELRPIAAQRALALARSDPARVRPRSFNSTIQAQIDSLAGPVAPPTEWALQDISAEGTFLDAHQLSSVSGGNLNISTKLEALADSDAICVIFVVSAIIEDPLHGHGLRTPADSGG